MTDLFLFTLPIDCRATRVGGISVNQMLFRWITRCLTSRNVGSDWFESMPKGISYSASFRGHYFMGTPSCPERTQPTSSGPSNCAWNHDERSQPDSVAWRGRGDTAIHIFRSGYWLPKVRARSCPRRSVISRLRKALGSFPAFRIATGSAAGDTDKQTPFILLSKQTGGSDIGKSLWTNELESDLVTGKTKILVHSLKDMPTTLPPKCLLGAVPEREDASDAVIMRADSKFKSIDELPPGSVVRSGSSRRKALVRRNWPHLEVVECRGNV